MRTTPRRCCAGEINSGDITGSSGVFSGGAFFRREDTDGSFALPFCKGELRGEGAGARRRISDVCGVTGNAERRRGVPSIASLDVA